MSDPRLIGPVIRTAPEWHKRLFGRYARPLPDDLLRDASRRLHVLSALFIVLWVVGTVLYRLDLHIQQPESDRWISWQVDDWFSVAGVLVAIAFYFFSRKPAHDPKLVINLGLVFLRTDLAHHRLDDSLDADEGRHPDRGEHLLARCAGADLRGDHPQHPGEDRHCRASSPSP